MKKMILLCALFSVVGSVSFVSGFSHTDAAKMGHRFFQYGVDGVDGSDVLRPEAKLVVLLGDWMACPQALAYTGGSVMHRELRKYSPFTHTYPNWKHHDNPVLNVVKNHIWYSPDIKDVCEKECYSGWGGITQPLAFAAADFSIKKGAKALNEFDSVQSITQSIPEQHRTFLYKNGKMVAASAVAQLARTAVEQGSEGMTSANAGKFLKISAMQVAAEGLEEYAVTPVSDYLLGKEDSTAKDLLNCGLSIAGFVAVNAVIGK